MLPSPALRCVPFRGVLGSIRLLEPFGGFGGRGVQWSRGRRVLSRRGPLFKKYAELVQYRTFPTKTACGRPWQYPVFESVESWPLVPKISGETISPREGYLNECSNEVTRPRSLRLPMSKVIRQPCNDRSGHNNAFKPAIPSECTI